MKTGIIVPTRGDRSKFLDNLKNMINKQTTQPDEVLIVDHTPESNERDITQRYRIGYDHFRGKNFDCILLMEDDDYYNPNYITIMVNRWQLEDKPDLLGHNYTIYYHIGLKKWLKMVHPERASAMNTLIKPDLNITWPPNNEPYTDLYLWMHQKHLNGITFKPAYNICLGIKHNTGLTGGAYHTDDTRYKQRDYDLTFLRDVIREPDTLDFYVQMGKKIARNEK